jgi:hypothetical protein
MMPFDMLAREGRGVLPVGQRGRKPAVRFLARRFPLLFKAVGRVPFSSVACHAAAVSQCACKSNVGKGEMTLGTMTMFIAFAVIV